VVENFSPRREEAALGSITRPQEGSIRRSSSAAFGLRQDGALGGAAGFDHIAQGWVGYVDHRSAGQGPVRVGIRSPNLCAACSCRARHHVACRAEKSPEGPAPSLRRSCRPQIFSSISRPRAAGQGRGLGQAATIIRPSMPTGVYRPRTATVNSPRPAEGLERLCKARDAHAYLENPDYVNAATVLTLTRRPQCRDRSVHRKRTSAELDRALTGRRASLLDPLPASNRWS